MQPISRSWATTVQQESRAFLTPTKVSKVRCAQSYNAFCSIREAVVPSLAQRVHIVQLEFQAGPLTGAQSKRNKPVHSS